MNPVARAIAREKLMQSMRAVKISLYLTEDGAEVRVIIDEVSKLISTTLFACHHDKVDLHLDIMREALEILADMSEDQFRWRKSGAVLLDDAMDAVLLATPKLSAKAIHYALTNIEKIEKEARKK